MKRLYPDEAEDIINWHAQRVQFPGEKINYALVMGGGQGIGKDWISRGGREGGGGMEFS